MRVEVQTYSSLCGVLCVYGVFFYKKFSNFIFCKMSKYFFGGFISVFECLEENSPNCKKQTFGMCGHQFSRRIFPLSNVTARQQCLPAGQQFSRCWPAGEHLIWAQPCDLDLANESTHLSRKHTSYITIYNKVKREPIRQHIPIYHEASIYYSRNAKD